MITIGLVVLALTLVGGHSPNTDKESESSEAIAFTQAEPRHGAGIISDPVLLYSSSDGLVNFTGALRASQDAEVTPAGTTPVVAVESTTMETEATITPEATATPAIVPTATPSPAAMAVPARPAGNVIYGHATAYGTAYNGRVLGCGTGYYASDDPTIIAVGPARYGEWPCGTKLQICGPAGCIIATRQDGCPGCYANLVDLSEAGNSAVCGAPPNTCSVTIQVVSVP